jgi:peptide/nickel transport system permease protein
MFGLSLTRRASELIYRFLLLRIGHSVPTVILLSVLVFGLFQLIPGDYLSEMQMNPAIPKERIEDMRTQFGLDQPFYIQYFIWVKKLMVGEMGYSFAQRRPAIDLISERFTRTLILTGLSLLISLTIIFPAAVISALNAGRRLDQIAFWFSLVGLSLPSVIASLLLLYFGYVTRLFPVSGNLILPALTLSIPTAAFLFRTLRLEMIETLSKPFIVAARAKGLPNSKVIWHAFRNSINPVISLAGITLGGLLSGSVVVEKVFNWPGLGALVVDSIISRDLFVALYSVLISAILIILANLLADLLLWMNDPRISRP